MQALSGAQVIWRHGRRKIAGSTSHVHQDKNMDPET